MTQRICGVVTCDRPVFNGTRWCMAHHARLRLNGTLDEDRPVREHPPWGLTPAERFWRRVENQDDPESCWPWRGARDTHGYGRTSHPVDGHARKVQAPRAAFYFANGYFPPMVRHACDNPPCCNPAHLLPGTHTDNMRDAVERGRFKRPGARLTPDDVREMRRRYAAGEKITHLAAAFGVGRGAAFNVVYRKTWADI